LNVNEVNGLTPEQHNKFLAWSHIGYGSTMVLLMMAVIAFIWAMLRFDANPPPPIFLFFITLFILVINGAMMVPSFVAGYGLLKKKNWAKTWAIISAVLAAAQFPIGTGVCIYTFCFLFSERGRAIFEPGNYALPPGRQTWANQQWDYDPQRQREGHYAPPPSPPDWR
jgi:hypothetical protein